MDISTKKSSPGLPTKTKMEIFAKTKMEITYHMEIPKFPKFLSGENTFCFGWIFCFSKAAWGCNFYRSLDLMQVSLWSCSVVVFFFFFCC